MLDRVREAIFSTLAPWLDGACVLDLFAGSGSLSFEAVSRGARLARLVENDPRVVVTAGNNAEELGMSAKVQLVCADALEPRIWESEVPEDAVVDLDYVAIPKEVSPAGWDVCLCDPPYPLLLEPETRARVLHAAGELVREYLAPDGILVLHAPARALDEADLAAPDLQLARRTYGSNAIWYVQRAEAGE